MELNMTLCLGHTFEPITATQCMTSRLTGSILIIISMFSVLFNVRYLYWSFFHQPNRYDHRLLTLSMIVSSSSVIIVIVPSVIAQNLTCHRLCSAFYCQLEGFVSYLNGCVHMFTLMMISVTRYRLVLHADRTKKYFRNQSLLAVLLCWFLGLLFALPPFFNWNKYLPEGLGYHCGLNWFDHSRSSRLYLIFAFLFVYFIPLIVLSIVNLRVYHVIRRLLYKASIIARDQTLLKEMAVDQRRSPGFVLLSNDSFSHSESSVRFRLAKFFMANNRFKLRQMTDPLRISQLKRLKADRRFALATIALVSEYLLSWTPYACVTLLYLFHVKFITEQPLFITICAFIAKISMIINPFIYISIIKSNQLRTILFWRKCSCSNCKQIPNFVVINKK